MEKKITEFFRKTASKWSPPDWEELSDQQPQPKRSYPTIPQASCSSQKTGQRPSKGKKTVKVSVKTVRKLEKDFNIELIFETDDSRHNVSKLCSSYFTFCECQLA